MKKLILVFTAILLTVGSYAQDVRSISDEEFREMMNAYVTKGNIQYDRSYRNGIRLYADSIEYALQERAKNSSLERNDSLEFTADLYKLRGDWHYENGNYDEKSYKEAERLLRQAEQIYEENSSLPRGLNHLPIIRRDMAQLMYKLGRYQEALSYTDSAFVAYERAYDNGDFYDTDSEYLTMLNLQSQKAMCLARTGNTEEALKLMDDLLKVYPKTSEDFYEVLRKKAKILMLSQKTGCEKQALELYKQYFVWRKADALKTLGTMTAAEREDYWMRTRPFIADCYQLENEDPAFLYDVSLFAKGLLLQLNRMSGHGVASESALASLQHKWTDIQKVLAVDACAIEFVQYEKLGKQRMGAIVLKKTGQPQWVQMMDPDVFYDYKIGDGDDTNRKRLAVTGVDTQSKRNRLYNDEDFCGELWNKDLVSRIGKASKIYFAPDGYLQQMAIEYMDDVPFPDAEIFRLSSTRRLIEATKIKTDAALVVGGVRYSSHTADEGEGNDQTAYEYFSQSHSSFLDLEGSKGECDVILQNRNNPKDRLLSGDNATEDSFIQVCNQYPLLLLSTHGSFDEAHLPQGTDVKPVLTDESLSHALIAFAGINTNTSNSEFDSSHRDGLLSARELSAIDMSNVDMAVLSACQTGLGYITSDGVFGIQRGFKNAGVDCLVVSLWEVSDAATRVLMTSFFKYLGENMTPHKALMKARDTLRDSEAMENERKRVFNASSLTEEVINTADSYDTPYFRNAFIMIDAIE